MDSALTDKAISQLWIISSARNAKFSYENQRISKTPIIVREYRISSIGRYLISPEPLNTRRWLAGCEIRWRKPKWAHILTPFLKGRHRFNETMTLRPDFSMPRHLPDDENLGQHIQTLQNKLRSFDSLASALDTVDHQRVADVHGISEDDAGNRSRLMIDGSIIRKLNYVRQFVGKKIHVRFNRARLNDGLFEMSGFDFTQYDPRVSFRLIRFMEDDAVKAGVLNDDDTVAFWLDDPNLINYLQLFESSIQQNHQMHDSLCRCIQGDVAPLRLMFNLSLEIDYSQAPLPARIKEMLDCLALSDFAGRLIKENLNSQQVGVSLNTYSPQSIGNRSLCTDVSILQNLCALEPVKQQLPELFAELSRQTNPSDAGNFYLLDAIRGVNHETSSLYRQ